MNCMTRHLQSSKPGLLPPRAAGCGLLVVRATIASGSGFSRRPWNWGEEGRVRAREIAMKLPALTEIQPSVLE